MRATYALENLCSKLKNLGLAAELNGGSNFNEDRFGGIMRFEITYGTQLRKGNHTTIKFLPLNTSPDKKVQLSTFSSQSVGKLDLSALIDYDIGESG